MAAIIRECCQRFNGPGGIPYPWIMRKLQAKILGVHTSTLHLFIYNASAAMFRKRPRASRTLGFQPFDVLDPVAEGTSNPLVFPDF